MNSLREAARKIGIQNGPFGARMLAQATGLAGPTLPPGVRLPGQLGPPPPVSLRALLGVLDARPAGPVKAGPVEEAKFEYVITTPTGTALGGRAKLTLRSDGTYKSEISMRSSGLPDYVFSVRSIFTDTNGLSLVIQHTGKVRGTSLNPFDLTKDSERVSTGVEEGSSALIKDNWATMKAGRLGATKEYSPIGLSGVVLDIAGFLLEAGAHTVGAGLGIVIGLGHEMGKVFGDVGLVGGFTIISGVVVFASGGTLVMALPVGATVGAVTNALIKQRQLTAQEAAFAAQIFDRSLPPREKIWLTNLTGIGDRAFTMPGFDNGNIYLNLGGSYNDPMAPTESYPMRGQLLIHELVHAWQIHHSTFLPGTVCKGVVNQARNEFGGSVYNPGPPGPPWGEAFNLEQQGSIVDGYYARARPDNNATSDMKVVDDPKDPYFMYIRDNIRPGRT